MNIPAIREQLLQADFSGIALGDCVRGEKTDIAAHLR